MAYRDIILATANLVSYWELNETSGTTAADSKGSTPLTYAGGYTQNVSAIAGTGVLFNGTSAVISTASTPVTSVTSAALECWFKLSDLTQINQGIVHNGHAAGYGLCFNGNNTTAKQLYVLFSNVRWINTGITISDKNWHHVVLNIKTGGNIDVYIDSILMYTGGAGTAANTPNGIYIGKDETSYWFDGYIDEVGLYSANLSGATVAEHYQSGKLTSAISRWNLNDTSGTTAVDSISGFNGTYTGTFTLNQTTPPITPSTLFDGSTSYVTVPHNDNLAIANAPISIEAWIKTTSSSSMGIVAKYNVSGNSNGYGMQAISGKIQVWMGLTGWIEAPTLINDGDWHHIVAIGDGTTMFIYIDGQLDYSIARGLQIYNQDQPLQIGRLSSNTVYFNGNIGRVAIYNYVLTLQDIQANYNTYIPVKPLTFNISRKIQRSFISKTTLTNFVPIANSLKFVDVISNQSSRPASSGYSIVNSPWGYALRANGSVSLLTWPYPNVTSPDGYYTLFCIFKPSNVTVTDQRIIMTATNSAGWGFGPRSSIWQFIAEGTGWSSMGLTAVNDQWMALSVSIRSGFTSYFNSYNYSTKKLNALTPSLNTSIFAHNNTFCVTTQMLGDLAFAGYDSKRWTSDDLMAFAKNPNKYIVTYTKVSQSSTAITSFIGGIGVSNSYVF